MTTDWTTTTGRYEADAYDHWFPQHRGRRFDDLDEALVYAARHRSENGRTTNLSGRNTGDVTWMVRDLEADPNTSPPGFQPGPLHILEAARLDAEDQQRREDEDAFYDRVAFLDHNIDGDPDTDNGCPVCGG